VAIDMSQYMGIFLEESREHLSNLNQHLLKIEKNFQDEESLNEIFRAAHTLKGMASTMGVEDLADLTHHMENVLSALKEGQLKVNTKVINTLFQCFDRMQSMLDSIESSGSSNFDNIDLINNLENIRNGSYKEDINPGREELSGVKSSSDKGLAGSNFKFQYNSYDITVLKEAFLKGYNVFSVQISIDESCLMKAVRAFMVFKCLEEDGEIIKSVPHVQDLDEGNFENDFNLLFISKTELEKIENRINAISEIQVTAIDEISESMLEVNNHKQEEKTSQNQDSRDAAENKQIHKFKKNVRVDIDKLDMLMNLVGELVMYKGCLEQIGAAHKIPQLNETIEQMDRISTDLQSVVMIVRMLPVENVFNRFPRMVRDLAQGLNKEVEFIMEGKETELDRTVIDEIGEPLVHLLRNALDHGIELPQERIALGKPAQGTLLLGARHEGNNIYIDVKDDGRGINAQLIAARAVEKGIIKQDEISQYSDNDLYQLIFTPGFSTASQVSDISGRGVGLDVVKTKIESLNGEISIETKPGNGTRFRIKLPLTLAIIQALMVAVNEEIYAIPLSSVNETTLINKSDIKVIQNQEVITLRGDILPLFRLHEILAVPEEDTEKQEMYVVVVRKGERQIGLVVDALIGQQEIVIKSLGKILSGIPGLAGAIIAGDGNVRLILDIATLF